MTTKKAISETIIFVVLFFPAIFFIEIGVQPFFAPFVEEALARLLPLLVVLYTYHNGINPFTIGIAAGMTFGALEVMTKVLSLGYLSYMMFVPVVFVHIPNAVLQSVVVNFSYNTKSFSLIPVVYVICVMWHWVYNANLYVV